VTPAADAHPTWDPSEARLVGETIVEWFSRHGRWFPWRWVADPYRVLVVETLLQRTRAASVSRVYGRFFEKYPAPLDLARTNLDRLRRLLEPLGLAYRAQRLVSIAREVDARHGGRVPADMEALLRLPGVGVYVASCVLAFGHLVPMPVVDRNVMRVLNRHAGVVRESAGRELVRELFEHADHRVVSYALIDLGAMSCLAERCECPLGRVGCVKAVNVGQWRMLRKVIRKDGVALVEQPVISGGGRRG
jgi:A/G-specific adenine glycosylase